MTTAINSMIDSTAETQKRILVALDTFQDFQALLDIAASLAKHQGAEISALFVEDINLIHLAGLPFAREIERLSTTELQLDASKIHLSLEKQAERIRYHLSNITRQSHLQISMTVVRGQYVTEALAAATGNDLLLLEKRTHRQRKITSSSRKKQNVRPVWVIFDGSEAAAKSLLIAAEFSKSSHAELNIVLKTKDAETVTALKLQVRQLISDFAVNLHFFVQDQDDFTATLQNILQRGCSIIIINRNQQDTLSANQLASLFSEQAGCPVLLV